MQEKLRVGTVVTTHGLKGEAKVYPTTEDPDRFFDLDKVWLDLSGSMENLRELHVERVRFSKNLAIVKFEGIDSIDDVLPFRHGELYVDRADAIQLEEGEYFVDDVSGECLGTVKDILETGANNVLIVKNQKKDLMIPYVRGQFVTDVQPEQGFLKVHLIPGILDL